MTTALIITGASGRMGKTIISQAINTKGFKVVGATEHPSSLDLNKDAGIISGQEKIGVPICASLKDVLLKTAKTNPVIIDFTSPEATLKHLEEVCRVKAKIVIGTTGLKEEQIKKINKASGQIPIVMAPNMSVGVNVLFKLVHDAAKILGEEYDLEILEAHHRLKKDAPSGTAVRLAEILAKTTGRQYPQDFNFHRQGIIGERSSREIGMQIIRGGDIVGEHTVFYCGSGEKLEIKHIATSRKTFADGALRAANWLGSKTKGLFCMQDVLDIPSSLLTGC